MDLDTSKVDLDTSKVFDMISETSSAKRQSKLLLQRDKRGTKMWVQSIPKKDNNPDQNYFSNQGLKTKVRVKARNLNKSRKSILNIPNQSIDEY